MNEGKLGSRSHHPIRQWGIQNTSDKVTRVINVLVLENGKPASTPIKD